MTDRAIDRHEEAIVEVLHEIEMEGRTWIDALDFVGHVWGIPVDRLERLVRCWCAVAGFDPPD